ncbi:CAP domain-containing protein [Halomarina ordinaria]|uniref:CAP domain-containing protein n=1 Tax=Halomarina ordinaria TaxID=3033939 RepID=A0ABD5UBP9_9EURY|nr:CAP domain-containing protein [Halomarina sp. PSRA2]
MTRVDRRRFLASLAGAGSALLAGCLGVDGADVPPLPDLGGPDPATSEGSSEPPSVPTPERVAGIDPNALERRVHAETNAARTGRDLDALDFDTDLRAVARYHSADMARREYFAHESPDGETVGDRYDRFGYDCRAPTGLFRYATAGENLFMLRFAAASEDVESIAERAVEGWLESPGHRENLLSDHWRREGIGVAFDREGPVTAVYVTQNFC